MNVKEIMATHPVCVFENDTVLSASKQMAKHDKGMLVVFDSIESKRVVGVLSNHDIVNSVIASGASPSTTIVKDVMSKDVVTAKPDDSTSDVMLLMRKHHIKRVVILDRGFFQGVVSSNDIMHAIITHKKKLLEMAIDL